MNNNCIYYHLKPCGEVFYIGIGNNKIPSEETRAKMRESALNRKIRVYN